MATNARQHIDDEELDDLESIEGVDFVTREEWMEIVDAITRRRLGIGASEFAERYRAGMYSGDGSPEISYLAMLIASVE